MVLSQAAINPGLKFSQPRETGNSRGVSTVIKLVQVCMYTVVSPENIQLPPGGLVRLPASWQDYQLLTQQRGDHANPRLRYRQGEVLLMSPLPKHGRDASLVADIVKVLLDITGLEYDSFTPVTMEIPEQSGIEPDDCFYIDHWEAVSGKARIDWHQDPPPDLVVEIDVTSFTNINDYLPYRVPEIWLMRRQQLCLYSFVESSYELQSQSRYFPEITNLQSIVLQAFQTAYDRNTSAAIRELRHQLA
jgi:Uma2 family endonuclease